MKHALSLLHYSLSLWIVFATSVSWGQDTGARSSASPAAAMELRKDDRIVFLGGTFIERMQNYGYLETLLTVAQSDKHLTFRNLGWSGDTVWGESRGVFGTATEGFKRLVKDVSETKPTVIVVCYGANEANAGPIATPRFAAGLNQLLDALAPLNARILLVSPPKREKAAAPLPDPHAYNEVLSQYAKVIEQVAIDRHANYFDLFAATSEVPPSPAQATTINGMHYSEYGDWFLATRFAQAFGVKIPNGTQAANDVAASSTQWQQLRQAIADKNVLYFYRHRPQNETYLFLFRKHEQGNNAVEIPQYDPLIAEKEKQIAEMPQPKVETFSTIKIRGANLSSAPQ